MIDGSMSAALDAIDRTVDDMKGQYRPGYVPELDENRLQGAPRTAPSLDPMHVVPPAGTYLVGVDALGRRSFSRDGALAIVDGKVVLPGGSAALGYPSASQTTSAPQVTGTTQTTGAAQSASSTHGTSAAPSTSDAPGPLALDPTDVALGRATNVRVEADGTVAYDRQVVDPKTQAKKTERVAIGRLALATFPDGTRVSAPDGVHVTVPAGVEPRLGRAGDEGCGKLVLRADDRGGIDLQRGMSHLREAYLAFSVLQSAHGARGKTDKTVMDLLK